MIGSASQFGDLKKDQAFMHTSPAFGIGKGERSNPVKLLPTWTPSPNTYNISKDGAQNDLPRYK
jgi:hypothetical protein